MTPESPIVLGSASPRRRELFKLTGVPFLVCAADADESALASESADRYLERIARAKLAAVRAAVTTREEAAGAGAILVADTIVVAPDASVLGKPSGDEEGRAMLERLGGATHTVQTRFVLGNTRKGDPAAHEETVLTRVSFRAFAPGEVARYVASGEGRDKAGGYAAQGAAAVFIERIDGSYTNVVGLPVCEVVQALRALNWLPSWLSA